MKKKLLVYILVLILCFSIKVVYAQAIYGKLVNNTGDALSANISAYQQRTITNSSLTVNGNYFFSIPQGRYDLNYEIFNFIPNFFVRLLSLDVVSDVKDKVNNVTNYSDRISFSVDSNGETVQIYSEKKPNSVKANDTNLTEVSSLSQLANNTWFYNATENKLYINPIVNNTTISNCSDGTFYGQCSSNKPKYCDNGNLINKCSLCNCSTGYSCLANESCNLTTIADYYVIGSSGSYTAKNSSGNTILTGSNAATVISTVLGWMAANQTVEFVGTFTIDAEIDVTKSNITMDFTQATITATSTMAFYINVPYVKILGGHWIGGTVNQLDGIRFGSTSGTNCTIDGADFENFEIAMQYGSAYETIQNCTFHDMTRTVGDYFIVCNGFGHNTIRNCTFLRTERAGMFIGPDSGYNLIENCEFGYTHNHAIYNDGRNANSVYGPSVGHNEITSCKFHDFLGSNGAALHIKTQNNNIHHNDFWNWPASYTISLYSELEGYTANDNEIHHNTFTDCAYAIVLGHSNAGASPTDRNLVHDNVFTNCTYAITLSAGIAPQGTICSNASGCPSPVDDTKIYYNDFHSCPTVFHSMSGDVLANTNNMVIAYNYIDADVSVPAWVNTMSYQNTFFPPNTIVLAMANFNYSNITDPASWYYVAPRA